MPIPMNRSGFILRKHGPCSPCGDGDTALEYHTHEPSSPSYTLKEIEALAHEFIGEPEIDNYERRLLLSVFVQWLARREREGRG